MNGPGMRDEIREALSGSRRLLVTIGVFSAFVNLLMLTGPVFMLQLYDRVLASRSEATLVALAGMAAFLFLVMGLLDHARARVLARVGARFQKRLDARVLGAILDRAGRDPRDRSQPATGLRDLEAMQRFASGSAPFAFFDAPWTPAFLAMLFLFHPYLGILAVASGVLLLALTLVNQSRTSALSAEAGAAGEEAVHIADRFRAGAETVRGLGMADAALARTAAARDRALQATIAASDLGGAFSATARTLRLFLQSAMLGLGAWLAIRGEVTPGVMIAASILLGRALAPVDQAVAQWPVLQRTLEARRSLSRLLAGTPPAPEPMALPAARSLLEARGLTVVPPGGKRPTVVDASLRLEPGRALGITGPSGSGKSTLARALAGVWAPARGAVRLDEASLDQYGDAARAFHIGWLPQEIVLFDGTVAENIARFRPTLDAEAVVQAAQLAGAHRMILGLPGGYGFRVASGGAMLSGGQRQRIGLARAFFDDPAVVILDEPDAHLDREGAAALNGALRALKERDGAAIVVAHRQGAFAECDLVLEMQGGRLAAARPAVVAERSGPARLPAGRTRPGDGRLAAGAE